MNPTGLPIRLIEPNRPQLLSLLYSAPITVDAWSRASGKSFGHAARFETIAFEMPRSKNVLEGRTFQQVLTKTLPGVINALEKRGYYENVHFVLNQKPPAKWARCYEPPGNYENTMAWITGALFQIISQDRAGDARGLNIDSITGDEVLTLDQNKLETGSIAANRGNKEKFKKCLLHHSLHLSSSKGFGSNFKWFLDFGKYYEADGHNYNFIQNKIIALKLQFIDNNNKEERQQLSKDILALQKQIRWYPSKQGIYYSEADVFDNMKNLPDGYIKGMRAVMTDMIFLVEMLNKTFEAVENGFYNIIEAQHLYDAPNYSYLESLDYNIEKLTNATNDCRKDADIRADLPLDIALDYGANINTLVVGQSYDNIDWTINALYVKRPKLTQDVVHAFCDYYEYHKTKEVNYIYDHTAKPTDGKSSTMYYDEVCKVLIQRGWTVYTHYIGQAPHHHDKFLLSGTTLKEGDARFSKQRFNRTNCKYLLLSMNQSPVKQGEKGFKKDKSNEARDGFPDEEATHFGDAWDTMHWWKNYNKIKNKKKFYEITVG